MEDEEDESFRNTFQKVIESDLTLDEDEPASSKPAPPPLSIPQQSPKLSRPSGPSTPSGPPPPTAPLPPLTSMKKSWKDESGDYDDDPIEQVSIHYTNGDWFISLFQSSAAVCLTSHAHTAGTPARREGRRRHAMGKVSVERLRHSLLKNSSFRDIWKRQWQ